MAEALTHYHRLLTHLPDPAILVEKQGNVRALNNAAFNLFDAQLKINDSVIDRLSEKTQLQAQQYLYRCAKSSQVIAGRLHLTSADMSIVCYGSLLEPQTEQHEALIFLRLVEEAPTRLKFNILKQKVNELNREVDHRFKTQLALQKQTLFLETTLNSMGEGVIVTDTHSAIMMMNPVAEEITGWTLSQVRGKKISEVLHFLADQELNLNAGGATTFNREKIAERTSITSSLITKHGTAIAVEMTIAPLLSKHNEHGFVMVFHDISEKQALEQELRARAKSLATTNEKKNQFMTMLAHELRAPIAPISYAAELIKHKLQPDSAHHSPLYTIERKVGHLKRLVDDLLDVSRINTGKMKIVKTNVNFSELTSMVCEELERQFTENGVKLSLDLPASQIWVRADADRLTQVLHNILFNALKFTPHDGEVKVILDQRAEEIHLCIVDTGVGIEGPDLENLFEPFSQAEQALDRSSGGLGLGLALTKGIVDLHGGAVRVSSKGRNQGTTLDVTLPLVPTPVNKTEFPLDNDKTELHRILLIEDDHDTADMMCELLSMKGHSVSTANTGPQGVLLAEQLEPTFIFCDIGLPEMNGFEVVEALRSKISTAQTPIVALSGYGEKSFVDRALSTGFNAHIVKPASLQQLQNALLNIK